MTQAPNDQILRVKEVEGKIGLKKSTIYEMMESGDFPPSISLGKRAVGWSNNEVDKWIAERIKTRNRDLEQKDHA